MMEHTMTVFSGSTKSVAMDANNTLAAMEKVEGRKRKVEIKARECSDSETKIRKEETTSKSNSKIDVQYCDFVE